MIIQEYYYTMVVRRCHYTMFHYLYYQFYYDAYTALNNVLMRIHIPHFGGAPLPFYSESSFYCRGVLKQLYFTLIQLNMYTKHNLIVKDVS